jgi:hypothetical protein
LLDLHPAETLWKICTLLPYYACKVETIRQLAEVAAVAVVTPVSGGWMRLLLLHNDLR